MGITDYTGIVGGPGHADQPNVARAVVAVPPQSATDSMEVMLVGYTSQYTYEVPPGNWSPRGKTLPAVGASCVVCFDHPTGDAWVPMWEGVDSLVNSADVGVNVGDVKMTVAAVAPPGWGMCNGQAVPRTGTTAALFALIGTKYGPGDGSTTFNLPNWQGKMPIGASTTYPLGSTGGEAAHTLSKAEMPVHQHGGTTGTGTTGTATTGTGTTGGGSTGTGTTGGSSTGGGTTGYVSNDHTHTYSGTTATENQGFNHNYSGTTSDVSQWNGVQGYNVWSCTGGANFVAITWGATLVGGDNRKYNDYAHQHTYSGTTATQNQNHNHNFSGTTSGISANHNHSVPALSIPGLSVPSLSVPGLSVPGLSVPSLSVPALSIANDGSGNAHNNLPPYEAVNYVIKY